METNHTLPFKNIDGLIFDLDGTLWDASATCTKAWSEALKQLGKANHGINQELIRSFSGLRIEQVFEQHFRFIPTNELGVLLECYKKKEAAFMKEFGGELYPGVTEVLTELLQKYRLFIVSNCLSGYIENFIEYTGLQNTFCDYEASGNTGLSKSENIKLLMARNGLKNAVYVGDTVWDQEAAMRNNIPFVFASYGFGNVPEAVYTIRKFAELNLFFL